MTKSFHTDKVVIDNFLQRVRKNRPVPGQVVPVSEEEMAVIRRYPDILEEFKLPIRGQILMTGAKITCPGGDRNTAYGDPIVNLGLAGELKRLVREHQRGTAQIGPAQQEALDNVLTKLARCYTGSPQSRDTYIDMANYAAIAGEAAEREKMERGEVGPTKGFVADSDTDKDPS